MRGIMRLALLGVPGAQGAGTRIYDFAAGATWPGTWTVAGGALIPAPALGDELFNNPSFEDWNTTTDAAAWIENVSGTSVIDRESTTVHDGTYAVRFAMDSSASSASVRQYPALDANVITLVSLWLYSPDNDFKWSLRPADFVLRTNLTPGTGWQYLEFTSYSDGSHGLFVGPQIGSEGTKSKTGYLDTASYKPFVVASLTDSPGDYMVDARITAKFTLQNESWAGVAQRVDDNNYVIAYFDGRGSIVLDKRVAGVKTQVGTSAQAHSATKTLALERDGTTYRVLWDGAVVIEETIADAVFSTCKTWAPFATHAGNVFSYVALSPQGKAP